jgi:hypothetical protein
VLPESARSAYPTSLSFELSRFLISDLKVLDAFGFGDLGLDERRELSQHHLTHRRSTDLFRQGVAAER